MVTLSHFCPTVCAASNLDLHWHLGSQCHEGLPPESNLGPVSALPCLVGHFEEGPLCWYTPPRACPATGIMAKVMNKDRDAFALQNAAPLFRPVQSFADGTCRHVFDHFSLAPRQLEPLLSHVSGQATAGLKPNCVCTCPTGRFRPYTPLQKRSLSPAPLPPLLHPGKAWQHHAVGDKCCCPSEQSKPLSSLCTQRNPWPIAAFGPWRVLPPLTRLHRALYRYSASLLSLTSRQP